MKYRPLSIFLIAMCALPTALAEQHVADIGHLTLESGDVIPNCRVGYYTVGELNDDRSNVLVFPTWFSGKAEDLERFGKIGPGLLADTDKYYVIAIDALGNGVSSSPSNTDMPGDAEFPPISIRDMVNSQYELLTGHLGFDHVDTVLGISMGGMQTLQWITMYPAYMDNAVVLDGTPKMTSYDLVQWQSYKDVVRAMQQGGFSNPDIGRLMSRLSMLTLFSPDYFVENIPPEAVPAFLEQSGQNADTFNGDNYVAHLDAMIAQDAFGPGDEAVEDYVDRIEANVLIVGTRSDHMVNPVPGAELAEAMGADYLSVDSNCGHIGSSCEQAFVNAAVAEFLAD